MKVIHDTPKNIKKFLREEIFQTDIMKNSLDKDFFKPLFDGLASHPLVFVKPTYPELESSHFTSWFRAIQLREYSSPGISDVYYLHELWHVATMPYAKNLPFNRWFNKMVTNEFEASVASEVMVYIHFPELRSLTFQHDIWYDSLVSQGISKEEDVKKERKRVMVSPNPLDFVELQIRNYVDQNMHFAHIWKSRYNYIETAMVDIMNSPNPDIFYSVWLDDHIEKDMYGVPFFEEALAFSKVYEENKNKYGNHNFVKN